MMLVWDVNDPDTYNRAVKYDHFMARPNPIGSLARTVVMDDVGKFRQENGALVVGCDSGGRKKVGPILLCWVEQAIYSYNPYEGYFYCGAWMGATPRAMTEESLPAPECSYPVEAYGWLNV